ncbi:Cyclic nucleotide-binding-like [Phytophthora cactorum]|nr:Cyclic nucleotide-binding-like [Phytophthora cactorum]
MDAVSIPQTAGKHVQYSAVLFWSFGLMSNSYAGELPKTEAQCCFTIFVLLTGAFLFAYVVGNISDVVELIDAHSRDFNAKLSSLRLLLAHFHLPSTIEEQLKTYFFFQRYHTITQEYLLERCLPPSLLTEIRLVHLQPMISKVGFLAGMEGSVTRMLVSQFVQALTVKDQFVFRLGEEGSDMFFVFTGIIDVLVPLETVHRRQSHDARINALGSPSRSSFHTVFPTLDPSKLHSKGQLKKVNELTSGSYFGEVALFTSKPRSAHARCKTSCVLYRLSRRSLELVFERYPDWKRKVLKIVNIQQEQQLLRNLYMEEQMDIAANTSKKVMSQVDILGDPASLSKNISAENIPQHGTRNAATRPLGTLKTAGSFFSSYKAQRSVSSETAVTLQMAQQKKDVIWVDMLLQCTDAQSAFHIQWLVIIAVGTIYMALIIPYRNSYDVLERLTHMRGLVWVDIWVNWNLKDGLESMELYENKQRDTYQKERLWIDVVAAIPIDHFLADFYQSPLLCLNRCLKLLNFPHYMREINRRSVAYEKNRLCTLWILLFVLMHWCAAMDISWTDPPLHLLMLRFLRGIVFASTAFIKKGKVFEPSNYADYTFTIFVDFVGLVTMAFMIGEMANLYVSYISNEVEFRKNHIAVDLYLERWHITGKLRARSHAFLSSLWSSHRGVSYQAIFDEIPQVIRTETIMHIANLPLRVFINNAITRAIAQHLKYEGYPRDECVIVEGSVSKEMYFVVKGYLHSTTNGDQPASSPKHYKKGDYFGEHGLLGYSVGVSTVKTMSACDLLSLSSEDLLQVILSRPLFQTALSIAVEGYRQLSKFTQSNRPTALTLDDTKRAEEDWGIVLFQLLKARKKKWLEEALSFTTGTPMIRLTSLGLPLA